MVCSRERATWIPQGCEVPTAYFSNSSVAVTKIMLFMMTMIVSDTSTRWEKKLKEKLCLWVSMASSWLVGAWSSYILHFASCIWPKRPGTTLTSCGSNARWYQARSAAVEQTAKKSSTKSTKNPPNALWVQRQLPNEPWLRKSFPPSASSLHLSAGFNCKMHFIKILCGALPDSASNVHMHLSNLILAPSYVDKHYTSRCPGKNN